MVLSIGGGILLTLGSSVNVSSNIDGITFVVQSLKKNIDQTLALVEERMFNPKFTEAAFNRIQNQNLESFKQAKADPASVANTVFAKVNYGPNNILGMSEAGTEYTIKNMKLQDIENLKLHKLDFTNNKAIAGEFTNVFHWNHEDATQDDFMKPPIYG